MLGILLMPHVILEALACGTPVVCFDISGVEIVKRYNVGVAVKAFDINDIVRGVVKIYDMWVLGKYKHLSIKAREIALYYDWQKIALLYAKMFTEVAEY